jgi:peptide/nickel transport system substrate-binding protein
VTPGNKLWINREIPHPERSITQAKEMLKSAGFSWDGNGKLVDARSKPVEFTIVTSSSNAQRVKMATLIADDLAQLGMSVHVVPLEFRAVVDRGLVSGDADPNGDMNVWMSNGSTHLWNMHESKPATPWEARLDTLLNQQLITLNYTKRKQIYDEAQAIIAENLPFIFLASPNVVVGAMNQVANFHPAALEPYVLWNADELYLRQQGVAAAK